MAGLAPQDTATATDDAADFVDPAEFLFTNTTYHDCFLTVIDPDTKNVVKMGVASSYLISQSSVFRKMLLNDKSHFKHIEINDVSPAVAKLMLTYIYAGKMPKMDRWTRAQLALAAHSYKLRYLEDECCRVLVPTTVDEVFPALICVVHLDNATLLPQVKKIIQEETDQVIKHSDFVKLDAKCMDFVASQETLAIGEVDLWKVLVEWATTNAGKYANKTARDVLSSPLQLVRLATFTHEQIMKEVLPTKILSDSEMIELLAAVFKKTTLDCPGLSGNTEVRSAPVTTPAVKPPSVQPPPAVELPSVQPPSASVEIRQSPKQRIFASITLYPSNLTDRLEKLSRFWLKSSTPVEIESFVIRSKTKVCKHNIARCYQCRFKMCTLSNSYTICYSIAVWPIVNGKPGSIISNDGSVQVPYSNDITLPFDLKDGSGHNFVLKEEQDYKVEISFTEGHPTYGLSDRWYDLGEGLKFATEDVSCHIKALGYKVLTVDIN